MNFEWVEVVRDLQTAEARIQELQAYSGEYVIFSQRTQQIVARFNSLMTACGLRMIRLGALRPIPDQGFQVSPGPAMWSSCEAAIFGCALRRRVSKVGDMADCA